MTEEIIIDVSNCPHKRDDECMEVPICNEYGDLMGYQSCEAQTLCPYRSQKKIEHLEQFKNKYYQQTLDDEITISDLITKCNDLEQENKELKKQIESQKGLITVGGKQQYEYLQRVAELEQENLHLREQLEPFNDVYFKDLTKGTIAQLAKTSLRNTADNCKLTHALEEIRDYLYTLATVDTDFVNTETYLRINDKIEEVLNS